jgi:hypothetical protein
MAGRCVTRLALGLFVAIVVAVIALAAAAFVNAFDGEPPCTSGASSITAIYDPATDTYVTSEPHVTGCLP